VARALLVGCGCRGQALGAELLERGWAVRGTTRREEALPGIEAAGIEAALADPARPGTVLDLVGDVTVIHWLLGSASGEPSEIAAIHGQRLQRLLEKLVDTPVRGFVYERAGDVALDLLAQGEAMVRTAAETWRIPVEIVDADPTDAGAWTEAMLSATRELTLSR
jgi:uncharacterized protein YbjT (DUF2867 family)